MIGFANDKVEREFRECSPPLRLVVEALADAYSGASFVFRLDATTKFEKGVHAAGLAADVELRGASEEEMLKACQEVNARFFPKGPGIQCATLKVNRANFPSGKRVDRPHVHIQIPFDWKSHPRQFLRNHGFTQG